MGTGIEVRTVDPRAPDVERLVAALTDELASAGYAEDETFGYPLEQLAASGVYLLGAFDGEVLVGIGGVEVDDDARTAELKRFYVDPAHRGRGVTDRLIADLLDHAQASGATVARLETGDKQDAAIGFYRRHGFGEIPRFGPYVDSATSVCMERPLD